jgi:hypothetical protein
MIDLGCVVFPYYVISALGLYFENDRCLGKPQTTTPVFAAGTVRNGEARRLLSLLMRCYYPFVFLDDILELNLIDFPVPFFTQITGSLIITTSQCCLDEAELVNRYHD